MIGQQSKSFLARTLQSQQRYGALIQASQRGFAGGGPKKPAIGADETDFDVVCIGKSPHLSQLLFFEGGLSLRSSGSVFFMIRVEGQKNLAHLAPVFCFNLIDCGSLREIIIIFRCLVFA